MLFCDQLYKQIRRFSRTNLLFSGLITLIS